MPPESARPDAWTQGEAYERYIGRWSRLVAHEFAAWVGAEPGSRWLDGGCGSGALTGEALDRGAASVIALDRSAPYVAAARAAVRDGRAAFLVGDLLAIPLATAVADVAVSGLVLNFVEPPELALSELSRVVRPGGTVAVYVWDYAVGMAMLRHFWDAAVELDPGAAPLDEGVRFPLCNRPALNDRFESVGLREVEVRPIDVPTVFRDFGDFWDPFLSGQGPAPGYVASLGEEAASRLRETLRGRLPVRDDGTIRLTARAWAARGVRGR